MTSSRPLFSKESIYDTLAHSVGNRLLNVPISGFFAREGQVPQGLVTFFGEDNGVRAASSLVVPHQQVGTLGCVRLHPFGLRGEVAQVQALHVHTLLWHK